MSLRKAKKAQILADKRKKIADREAYLLETATLETLSASIEHLQQMCLHLDQVQTQNLLDALVHTTSHLVTLNRSNHDQCL